MKLGIVGHGFVGTAVDHGFTRNVQKFIVDPKHNSTNTIEDLIAFRPDATFVSVPTPMLETGECNTAILEDVMQQLNKCKGLLVIVKSTVPAYKLEQIKKEIQEKQEELLRCQGKMLAYEELLKNSPGDWSFGFSGGLSGAYENKSIGLKEKRKDRQETKVDEKNTYRQDKDRP